MNELGAKILKAEIMGDQVSDDVKSVRKYHNKMAMYISSISMFIGKYIIDLKKIFFPM